MHVQPGYCFVTPCQTDNSIHIVRKEVTPHNGLLQWQCQHFPRSILLQVRFHACEPHSLDSRKGFMRCRSPSLSS
jgi:hypothetical protein